MEKLLIYSFALCFIIARGDIFGGKQADSSVTDRCFCKLKGEVDDCTCTIDRVDRFNNLKVYPRISSLVRKDYFRYWNVNLKKTCPFWSDDSRCALKDCSVDVCEKDDLPDGLKKNLSGEKTKPVEEEEENELCDDNSLGILNTTISDQSRQAFKSWKEHDDALDTFCELDDDSSSGVEYVDLTLNPERYTGYKGKSPHRIWRSIYKENCFSPEPTDYSNYLQATTPEMCLEKRAFYRMISGLHTSINIHLSAEYLWPDKLGLGVGTWGPNVDEFKNRFDPETTNNQGPQWLKNLYFTYLVEARALAKAAPYLEKEEFFSGNDEEDTEVKLAIRDLLNVLKDFPDQFDESKLFRGNPQEAAQLKAAFKNHFRNISRIMDCVGCDKCKLWGKLQVTGMGTALKILFSGDDIGPLSTLSQKHKKMEQPFQLRRQEIVALVNAFARLSKSIHEVEMFKERLKK